MNHQKGKTVRRGFRRFCIIRTPTSQFDTGCEQLLFDGHHVEAQLQPWAIREAFMGPSESIIYIRESEREREQCSMGPRAQLSSLFTHISHILYSQACFTGLVESARTVIRKCSHLDVSFFFCSALTSNHHGFNLSVLRDMQKVLPSLKSGK